MHIPLIRRLTALLTALLVLGARHHAQAFHVTDTILESGDLSLRCQEHITWATRHLTGTMERAFGRCAEAALPCLATVAGRAACCQAADSLCQRVLDTVRLAGESFEATLARGPCAEVAPSRLLNAEAGLGYSELAALCPDWGEDVGTSDLENLASCLRHLVEEDVLHRISNVDAPDAVDALACMALGDEVLAAFLDDPATCSGGGSGPGPTPSPSPQPSPGASCETYGLNVAVLFDEIAIPDMAGITVALDYPEGQVTIPGGGGEATVLQRIVNLTGLSGGLFSASDNDSRLNVGLISIGSPIPAGPFIGITFDCVEGAAAPTSSAFSCTVDAATILGDSVPATCQIIDSNE